MGGGGQLSMVVSQSAQFSTPNQGTRDEPQGIKTGA